MGACYAWSLFNEPLTREIGVIAQASNDWVLSNVVSTFMAIIVAQGTAMAVCGKWVEKVMNFCFVLFASNYFVSNSIQILIKIYLSATGHIHKHPLFMFFLLLLRLFSLFVCIFV